MKKKHNMFVVAKELSNAFLDRTIVYSIILNSCLIFAYIMISFVFSEIKFYTIDESIYVVSNAIKDIYLIYHIVFGGMTCVLAIYLTYKKADMKRTTKVIVLMCIHILFVLGLRYF